MNSVRKLKSVFIDLFKAFALNNAIVLKLLPIFVCLLFPLKKARRKSLYVLCLLLVK